MKTISKCMLSVCFTAIAGQSQAHELHEWGTFTTVSGSDGVMLAGLQVEEEYLPYFVGGHQNLNPRAFKGLMRPVRNVRVKMETPVIYFYGDKREKVSVHVGFNGGTVSQWFPPRTSGDTPPKMVKLRPEERGKVAPVAFPAINPSAPMAFPMGGYKAWDFEEEYKGFIHWDTEIIPRNEVDSSKYFRTGETPNWIYPQVPHSNIVKVGEVYEQYLFYRGLGNFTLPLTLSVDSAETLSMDFKGSQNIPFALAYERVAGKVRYKVFAEGLEMNSHTEISQSNGWTEMDLSPESNQIIYREMRDGLMAQGLNQHEADGMVKTWWNSYFGHDGLRVFWVLPENEVERILPMKVSPEPEKKVRVIVGRSEVLRPSFEKQLLAQHAAAEEKKQLPHYSGRYYEAYTERVQALKKVTKK
ncbi:hypothetical protein [Rubritalea squalenifaciens]|nr:hypothetical protein [Rubritalea squalenifaciens]